MPHNPIVDLQTRAARLRPSNRPSIADLFGLRLSFRLIRESGR